MKQAEDKPRWYYVDEAGDPNFYGKGMNIIVGTEGCSRTFSLGFLRTYDPQAIRSKLADVRLEVLTDRYLQDISSIIKSQRAFHAKDDCAEVRKLVYSALEKMDFGVQVVVARKEGEDVSLKFTRHRRIVSIISWFPISFPDSFICRPKTQSFLRDAAIKQSSLRSDMP